jgi:4-hydroxy-tetrahydrodipicolinate synthase
MTPTNSITPIGIVPVIPTPFGENQHVDCEALEPLIDFAARSGARAVCLPAYGSEFYKLSTDERFKLVKAAVHFAAGRLQVMAQSNHPSALMAAKLACRHEGMGAEIISFALPRQFPYGEDSLLRYAETIVRTVSVPVLVQDFNPGGPSVGASFARRLKESAPNFCYLKLEEPLMGRKIRAVHEATCGSVGVLEGWGGMYMIELANDGVAGAMPGLAMCDLFVRVFEKMQAGDLVGAARIHRSMLPQINLALQNMEIFHHCEKRLLVARGLLQSAVVREPAIDLDPQLAAHIDLVNRLVLEEAGRNGFT